MGEWIMKSMRNGLRWLCVAILGLFIAVGCFSVAHGMSKAPKPAAPKAPAPAPKPAPKPAPPAPKTAPKAPAPAPKPAAPAAADKAKSDKVAADKAKADKVKADKEKADKVKADKAKADAAKKTDKKAPAPTAADKAKADAKVIADKKAADAKAATQKKIDDTKAAAAAKVSAAKTALKGAGSAAKDALGALKDNPMAKMMATMAMGVLANKAAALTGNQQLMDAVSTTSNAATQAAMTGGDVKEALKNSAKEAGMKVAAQVATSVATKVGGEGAGALVGGLANSALAPNADAQAGAVAVEQTPVTAAFIAGLQDALKTADFDADTLTANCTINDAPVVVTIPLGYSGFGDAATPFDGVTATLGDGTDQAVIDELTPLLTLAPEEVFVLKLILMTNSANKVAAGGDFDADDFILANVAMLLYRLQQTGNGAYATSSQAAFGAVRDSYKPLFDLVQFPENHWYERVVTDMPGGAPTALMQAISALRWQAGHMARTGLFTTSIVPQLTAQSNPLEKSYCVYALFMHLQEYNGGFIKDDADDFVAKVIEDRLAAMKIMLPDAIAAMKTAGCNAEDIAKVQAFLDDIDNKPRVSEGDVPPLVGIAIPAVPVDSMGAGIAYFNAVIDPYMRGYILARPVAGEEGYLYFDFAYDADGAKEAIMALAIRAMRGLRADVITSALTDIYLRAGGAGVVDPILKYFAGTKGFPLKPVQDVAKAAQAGVATAEDNLDGTVMDASEVPADDA